MTNDAANHHGGIKIAIIGGGSTYTPELIEGLIRRRERIPLRTLTLMDTHRDRLEIVAGLARRMFDRAGYPVALEETTRREEALDGADFVIAQIRVGGMSARLIDETLPLQYGVIGQETVGPGGFSKALRTIPVMLEIAADIARLCPDAWLLNFTNPSGMVVEAISRYQPVKTVGLCNIPASMRFDLADLLGVPAEDVTLDYFGLNHLGWVRGVEVAGEARMDDALRRSIEGASREQAPLFSPELLETLGMLPSYYLTFYYNQPRMLTEQLQGDQVRAERVRDIQRELLKLYADPRTVEKPALLSERGGRHYSTAALGVIAALIEDRGEVHIVDVANRGTFASLPDDAIVEVPCAVHAASIDPLPAAPIPLPMRGLVETIKAYERLTIEAAVTGDPRTALQALMANPLVPSFSVARSLLAALFAEHIDYLPQFATALSLSQD